MPTFRDARTREAARNVNRAVVNPLMLSLAGRRFWYAAVIEHHGRLSGRSYRTPVIARRVADGIIVPLPYGTGVDWLRNVLAAGRARITVGGRSYVVTAPEVIDAAVAEPQLPPLCRLVYHWSNIDKYLKFSSAQ